MEAYRALLDLEDPLNRLCDGGGALRAFCLALDQEDHDLAGGLWVVWRYLNQQSAAVHSQYDFSLEQCRAS